MKRLLFSLFLPSFFLAACAGNGQDQEQPAPQDHTQSTRLMIAQTKLASDPHTWSKPNDIRVSHLNWDATVDFSRKVIDATATYDLQHLRDTNAVLFDTRGLTIHTVTVDGAEVNYTLGEEKPFIGRSLSIPVTPSSKQVSIRYTTAPDAGALLWVEGERPFLFTQSQAILARTWIPCQDSPGVRFTYSAHVKVPSGLLALMSAENPQQKTANGEYSFRMEQPVSSYLMALAVGDVSFRALGPRTGVYAIPSLVDKAAEEFVDMERMVEAAEQLYGPYVWERYDLLILPPAFPFGGMENPRLTFATPTILAGDRSLVSLVAHELAHSWSGNLVTNSTWNDFWLNEGFTVYFELRIMEAVYGKERAEMLALLARQDLDATLTDLSPEDTHLKLALEGRDPDDGMNDIAYNKGYFFLRLLEETVGREKFDVFLKEYFTSHAFQTMDTEQFVAYLREHLIDAATAEKIAVNDWIYGPGLPANAPVVASEPLRKVDELAVQWTKSRNAALIPWSSWTYQEQYRFLSRIEDYGHRDMAELDKRFHITDSGNSEVLFKWLENSVRVKYEAAYPRLESFLQEVGRRKFVAPLFEAMVSSGQRDLALKIYSTSRANYHAVTVQTVDKIVGWTNK